MTEISPARAACEAFWGTIRHLPGEDQGPGAAWRWAQNQHTESGWAAAAKAAAEAMPADLTDLAGWAQLLRERDESRAVVAEIRAILLEGGQDAATARRRAIAVTERAGDDGSDDPADRLLALPLPPNDSGASTVRGYLTALLAQLWSDPDGFVIEAPFGREGWRMDLYGPMVRAGFIGGALDDKTWQVVEADTEEADELILAAIERMGQRS